jgi:hypothetical protein
MLNFYIAGKDLFIDPIFYYFCQLEIVRLLRHLADSAVNAGCGPANAGLVVPSTRDSGRRGRD